jgi:ABC-type lipoprotein export system ATPase subunit
MAEPLIRVDGVSRVYDRGHVIGLREVDFCVQTGEFLAITGPSGSGKSTLLNIMGGLDRPSAGHIYFKGSEPITRRRWAAIRARSIGYVFQRFNLLATLTILQNVEIAMIGVLGARERRWRAQELLERVGMGSRMTHYPPELSVGERQRAAIARCLANSPVVILADEPTGSLDTKSSSSVINLLIQLHTEEKTALVIVSHDAGVAARARRLVSLEDGRIVKDEQL